MKLTTDFKDNIKTRFYDKEVDLISSQIVTENDGWTSKDDLVKTGSFFGNVRFNNLAKIQEDNGIKDMIDVAITTDTLVQREQIIRYKSILYKVISSIEFDSHYLVIAQKWSSRLSTSISA